MSAQASDMSGWLLLGLPGAVYTSGLTEIWVVIGLALGTYLNWKFVAPALRVQTEKYNSLTVPSFISQKLNDKKGYIRTFSAIVILFFFTIYSASGLVASGKLFDSLLGIDYKWGSSNRWRNNNCLYILRWVLSNLLDRFLPRLLDVLCNNSCSSGSILQPVEE